MELSSWVSGVPFIINILGLTKISVLKKAHRPLSSVESMCLVYAPLDEPDKITSSHALDLLADIYAEKREEHGKAVKALELLAAKFDPIRANYWNYRVGLIKAAA